MALTWKVLFKSRSLFVLVVCCIHHCHLVVSNLQDFMIKLFMTAGREAEFQGMCQRETTFSSFYLCWPA